MNQPWHVFLAPAIVGVALVSQAPVMAQTAPRTVVDQFYRWYITNQRDARQKFAQQRNTFTPELYQQLVQAFAKQPGKDPEFLDFDPFFNNQMGGKAFETGNVRVFRDFAAQVEVTVIDSRNGRGYPITVYLTKQSGRWQISNLVDFSGNSLLCILQSINRASRR